MTLTPIVYDHSSGKSILNFWKPEPGDKAESAVSVIKLCKDSDIKSIFYVSDNFSRFVESFKNCKEAGIDMTFGLEVWMCDDASQKTPQSLTNEHKVIIRMDNDAGYKDLIAIASAIFTNPDHFYYKYRFDLKQLSKLWTNNLSLVLPFYDSFIARNLLSLAQIVPELPAKPIICRELDGGLPFDPLINSALDEYNKDKTFQEIPSKTIYYAKKSHARSWMILRAIKTHKSFQKPDMENCCSDNFSWEDFLTLKQ